MYEIRPETLKTFVENSEIKLPRFQRKQTWNEIDNFKLCISLFKKYPIGVTIIEKDSNSTDQFLLDGRQRRNALDTFYNDPERIYDWARKFVKFKNNVQPDELVQLCREKISDYIEDDENKKEDDESQLQSIDEPDNTFFENECTIASENSITSATQGIDFLIEIIKIIHNKDKQQRWTGLTKYFYFVEFIQNLPYVSGNKIVSKKLRTFLREYKRYAQDERLHADDAHSFVKFMHNRFPGNAIQNAEKFENAVFQRWGEIKNRLVILDRIDSMFNNEKIGIIEVSDISQADSQKIFNIINTGGSRLTAAEIMSAQAAWNIPVSPSSEIAEKIKELYENMDIQQSDKFVRWDYPATILSSLTEADFIFHFEDSEKGFSSKLTLGFKLLAGIILGKMKKDDVNKLSKNEGKWVENYDTLINDLNRMLKVIKSSPFFQFFQTWKKPFHAITSDFVALCFIVVMYKDWTRKGKPVVGGASRDLFLKNAYALFDRLIFEYATSQWQASGDTRIARMLENNTNEAFSLVPFEEWEKLFNDIYEKDRANDIPVKLNFMQPILYLLYALKGIRAPQADNFDVDHIIPQRSFDGNGLSQKKDSLFNLGLLPKKDNISKGDKPLNIIQDRWLISQIKEYEFISDEERNLYSCAENYKSLFDKQRKIYLETFKKEREYQ